MLSILSKLNVNLGYYGTENRLLTEKKEIHSILLAQYFCKNIICLFDIGSKLLLGKF